MNRRDTRHRVNNGNRRLPAASDHVQIRRADMLECIDHRHDKRSDRRGREIDHLQARLRRVQEGVVLHVRRGGGRVEHNVDVLEHRQACEALHAFVCRRDAEAPRARESVGSRIDADHRLHPQIFSIT